VIVIPALSVRSSACAQPGCAAAVGGSDVADVARYWARFGFTRLHLTDLDAFTGRRDSEVAVDALLGAATLDIQLSARLRDEDRVGHALASGARYAVVGERALEDDDWLVDLADIHPGEVLLAINVCARRALVPNARRVATRCVFDVAESVAHVPLAGCVVSSFDSDGRLTGSDLPLLEDLVDALQLPVIAAGGIGSVGELYALQDRGVAGAVVGTALYSGAMNPWAVADAFAA
jgi:phosphoribosylformimino-5-aminoimidazole carboxamide ribotide isomerase